MDSFQCTDIGVTKGMCITRYNHAWRVAGITQPRRTRQSQGAAQRSEASHAWRCQQLWTLKASTNFPKGRYVSCNSCYDLEAAHSLLSDMLLTDGGRGLGSVTAFQRRLLVVHLRYLAIRSANLYSSQRYGESIQAMRSYRSTSIHRSDVGRLTHNFEQYSLFETA